MRTDATVHTATTVAVEAQDLESNICRVSRGLQPTVETATSPTAVRISTQRFSVRCSVIVAVIKRQECQARLTAALAFVSIMRKRLSFQRLLPSLDLSFSRIWVCVVSNLRVETPLFSMFPVIIARLFSIFLHISVVVAFRNGLRAFWMTFLPVINRLARAGAFAFGINRIGGSSLAFSSIQLISLSRSPHALREVSCLALGISHVAPAYQTNPRKTSTLLV
jgi:hypothetical protein